MRWVGVTAAFLCMATATGAVAATSTGVIWRSGDRVLRTTSCARWHEPAPDCRGIEASGGGGRLVLGGGYIRVRLLWRRSEGRSGPDLLVLGDPGGSGGDDDLFAVWFAPAPRMRKLSGARFDEVSVEPGPGPLRFEAPFVLGFFNGAPHAGDVAVQLPMVWRDGDFAIDLAALQGRLFTPEDLAFRTLAARNELQAWANSAYPTTGLFPPYAAGGTPTAAHAVLEPLLAGHVRKARAILAAAWPRQSDDSLRPMGGEDAFWRALCTAVVRSGQWTRLGLAHLREADLIAAGAEGSKSYGQAPSADRRAKVRAVEPQPAEAPAS